MGCVHVMCTINYFSGAHAWHAYMQTVLHVKQFDFAIMSEIYPPTHLDRCCGPFIKVERHQGRSDAQVWMPSTVSWQLIVHSSSGSGNDFIFINACTYQICSKRKMSYSHMGFDLHIYPDFWGEAHLSFPQPVSSTWGTWCLFLLKC